MPNPTKLTDRAIAALPARTTRYEVGDALVPGLRLVVQPTGSKSFMLRYYFGRPRGLTLGAVGKLKVDDARRIARAALTTLAGGADPSVVRQERRKAVSENRLDPLWKAYLERHVTPNLRAGTAADYRSIGSKYIVPHLGEQDVRTLRRRDVATFLDKLADEGVGARRSMVLRVLSAFMGWLLERDVIEGNPCFGMKAPVKITKRERVLTEVEIKALWTALGGVNASLAAMVRVLLLTGLRREEIAAMEWRELSPDLATLTLAAERTKSDRRRVVTLPKQARTIISALPRRGDFVFSTDGETQPSGFSKLKAQLDTGMVEALERPIEPWVIHDLRRSAATHMGRLGVPIVVVEMCLGHSIPGVAGVYQRHDFGAEQAEALQRWADDVDRIVGGNIVTMARTAR